MKTKLLLVLIPFLLMNFVVAQSFCVDFDPPSAPSNLAVTSSGTNLILTWGAATDIPSCSGIKSYTIKRNNPNNSTVVLGVVDNNTLSFIDNSDLSAGSYSYIVYATDLVGHNNGSSIKNDVVLSAPSSAVTGGGGGGGIRVIGGEAESSYVCYEDWQCDEWSECVNGEQTRTCTDSAKCGTTLNKPGLYQECLLTTQQTSRNFLTGAVTGITNFATSPGGIATFSGLIMLLIGSITLANFRKNRLSKKK